jgi:hypothetical protein
MLRDWKTKIGHWQGRHCVERRDEAIQTGIRFTGLLRPAIAARSQ